MLERFALHYAPEVAAELPETNPSGREFRRLVRAGELIEVRPAALHPREFGLGERAAVSVALEHPDWMLLIDDRRPFEEVTRLGLHVLCTPLVLVTLVRDGILSAREGADLFLRLEALQTVSPRLLDIALAEYNSWLGEQDR